LDDEYEIVHFSGHGTGTGLAFEDRDGRLYVPPQDAVAQLLADFSPPLKCLLLNACYSISQGQLTSLGVPFTVAMEGPISDDAAILFSGGFYDSIGAGKDVEFSFRQGLHALRLAGHPDTAVPHLLKKGEFTSVVGSATPQDAGPVSTRSGLASPSLLLGLGLDVSGSMEQNLRSSLGREQSRLRSFADAFEQSISRVRNFMESVRDIPSSTVSVFAYAFGMRSGDVCDLLSLMKVANGVASLDEIERLKQQFSREIERRYSGGSGLGGLEGLARSYGFGGMVESVKRGIRADAEAEVKNRIIGELQRRLATRL
jgi:hypothetical protein